MDTKTTHTHSSATDYIMSTATKRATRPEPTSNQQPEDHTQLRATNYQMVDRKTTHTQIGDGPHHVDGDWSRNHTSARTRLPTRRPHTGQSDGLSERGQEDHTYSLATDHIMSTATSRATTPAPVTTTDHQTTHRSE